MATGGSSMRRGLPRVAGGEPWPPAASAPAEAVVEATPVVESTVAEADMAPSAVAPTHSGEQATAVAASKPLSVNVSTEPVSMPSIQPEAR